MSNRLPWNYKFHALPGELHRLARLPSDYHIPGCPVEHHYFAPVVAHTGQFSTAIVILCEVNRNAHIIRALPGLWYGCPDLNREPLAYKATAQTY